MLADSIPLELKQMFALYFFTPTPQSGIVCRCLIRQCGAPSFLRSYPPPSSTRQLVHSTINDGICTSPTQSVANLLFPLIFLPYLKNIYGNGSMTTVRNASRVVAHW